MNEEATIEGSGLFHPYPVGAPIWRCAVCACNFCWHYRARAYCNGGGEPLAVVCSNACLTQLVPPTDIAAIICPVGRIGPDRIPRGWA